MGQGKRTVTQFHFRSWPAHGVPSSTKALLEFRRKVNKSYRGRSCPIVVHCSDGVGRAGTYVLIDMVLNRLSKAAKKSTLRLLWNIFETNGEGWFRTDSNLNFV